MNAATPLRESAPLTGCLRTFWALRPLRWQRMAGILAGFVYGPAFLPKESFAASGTRDLFILTTWVPVILGFAIRSLFQDALRLVESSLLPGFHTRVRWGAYLSTFITAGVLAWSAAGTEGGEQLPGAFGLSAVMLTFAWQGAKKNAQSILVLLGLFIGVYLLGWLAADLWLAGLRSPLVGLSGCALAALLLRRGLQTHRLRGYAGQAGVVPIPAHFSLHVTRMMKQGRKVSKNRIHNVPGLEVSTPDRSSLSFWVNRALVAKTRLLDRKLFFVGLATPFALSACLVVPIFYAPPPASFVPRSLLGTWLMSFDFAQAPNLPERFEILPYMIRVGATLGLIVVAMYAPTVSRVFPLSRKRLARLHWRLALGRALGGAGILATLLVIGTWAFATEGGHAWQMQSIAAAIGVVLVSLAVAPLGALFGLLELLGRSLGTYLLFIGSVALAIFVSIAANLLPSASTPFGSVAVPAVLVVASWSIYYSFALASFSRARLQAGLLENEDRCR